MVGHGDDDHLGQPPLPEAGPGHDGVAAVAETRSTGSLPTSPQTGKDEGVPKPPMALWKVLGVDSYERQDWTRTPT